MKSLSQILVNALTGWAAMLVRGLLALIIVPFLLNKMGQNGYGVFGLLIVILSFASLADMGLSTALGRELSDRKARNDIQGFRELSSTAFLLYFCIGTIVGALFFIFAPWLATTFKVSPQFHSDAVFLIRACGVPALVWSFVSPIFSAGLGSFMRFDMLNMIAMSVNLASVLLNLACLSWLPWDPLHITMWISSGTSVANTLVLWIFYRKCCYGGLLGLRYINRTQLKPLFQVGGYMYISQIANAISEQSDPLVISYFLGPAKVALYQAGTKVSNMISPVILALSSQLHPYTTRLHVENNQEQLRHVLFLNTRFTLLFGGIASSGLFIFAEPFCRIWLGNTLGPDYKVVAEVMKYCAIIQFANFCGNVQWPVLLGMKKLDFILWNNVPSAVLNVGLSVYFVGFTSMGVVGVLMGSIVARLVRIFGLFLYTPKLCGTTPWNYLKESYAAPLYCSVAVLITGGTMVKYVPCLNWLELITVIVVTSLAWAASVILFGIKKEERIMVRDFIRAKLKSA